MTKMPLEIQASRMGEVMRILALSLIQMLTNVNAGEAVDDSLNT